MSRTFSIFKRLVSTVTKNSDVYFGSSSLNRHAFLRTNNDFIAQSITSPYSKFIFFNNSEPIVDIKEKKLLTLDYSLLGPSNRTLIDNWVEANREKSLELNNLPLVHFLGLDNRTFSAFKYKNEYTGTPYYALEISKHDSLKEKIFKNPNALQLPTREDVNKVLDYYEANVFAQGKMYLEWIKSTPHCKGCGSKTIPIHAGSELKCTSLKEQNCPVKSAPVSNASFPRLDPVIISCVLSPSKDKALFTRLSKFPKGMYTHVAGFVEPGETIENAVKREVWEETGLKTTDVSVVLTQPWPYPANIMIGCVAIAENLDLNLENDKELEDAFWVDVQTLKRIVYEGEEDRNLTVFAKGIEHGIPNDKTIAAKLYQYVADTYV